MILCIKTDNPTAEIYLYDKLTKLQEDVWHADRALARDLLAHIEAVVGEWKKLTGIVVFAGPGSFTGLRIGITVANTLADGLRIPIVGETGDGWLENGVKHISNGENQRLILPRYGADPNITAPKK